MVLKLINLISEQNWRQEKEKSNEMTVELLSEWIKNKVIPAFTVVSVTYCKKVPGEYYSFSRAFDITHVNESSVD